MLLTVTDDMIVVVGVAVVVGFGQDAV